MTKNEFHWSFNGYESKDEAEKALSNMEVWFAKTFSMNDWTVSSSISKTAVGWKAQISAVKESG